MTRSPETLPDYQWTGLPPEQVGVPDFDWLHQLPPVPVHRPAQLPPAPAPQPGDLVPVHHRGVRSLGAYWHEGWPHAEASAWLRPEAAQRLYQAADSLPTGFGLAVWDGWRDPRLQQELYDAYYADPNLPPGFVSEPDPDPAHCPPHATGGTVDLTLTWQQQPLNLGTRFDAFVPAAAADALEADEPSTERNLRRLLAQTMTAAGFVVLSTEWWHWEYGTRLWAAATDQAPRYGRTSLPN